MMNSSGEYFAMLNELKKLYEGGKLDEINEQYPATIPLNYFDWRKLLTPIEWNAWEDICYLSLPMYPQIPVGCLFVDFGDPVAKIGVEIDGKHWHLDKEKDADRQAELEAHGWLIYRITGSQTYTLKQYFFPNGVPEDISTNPNTEKMYIRFLSETSEGILFRIRSKHYNEKAIDIDLTALASYRLIPRKFHSKAGYIKGLESGVTAVKELGG